MKSVAKLPSSFSGELAWRDDVLPSASAVMQTTSLVTLLSTTLR